MAPPHTDAGAGPGVRTTCCCSRYCCCCNCCCCCTCCCCWRQGCAGWSPAACTPARLAWARCAWGRQLGRRPLLLWAIRGRSACQCAAVPKLCVRGAVVGSVTHSLPPLEAMAALQALQQQAITGHYCVLQSASPSSCTRSFLFSSASFASCAHTGMHRPSVHQPSLTMAGYDTD